jgi:hypothetical protein
MSLCPKRSSDFSQSSCLETENYNQEVVIRGRMAESRGGGVSRQQKSKDHRDLVYVISSKISSKKSSSNKEVIESSEEIQIIVKTHESRLRKYDYKVERFDFVKKVWKIESGIRTLSEESRVTSEPGL